MRTFFYVQDVRYVVVPWMARSDACTGCTVCRGAMRPTWMWEGRAMQEQLPRWQGATHVHGCTGGTLLLVFYALPPSVVVGFLKRWGRRSDVMLYLVSGSVK